MNEDYALKIQRPAVDDYCRLRAAAGLSPRSASAAELGLPRTVVAVVIRQGEHAVGMGRVIGDGLFYRVVDIAV